ncbi:MAG: hypothetical protein ACJAWT_000933 [Glaciecola sp.]
MIKPIFKHEYKQESISFVLIYPQDTFLLNNKIINLLWSRFLLDVIYAKDIKKSIYPPKMAQRLNTDITPEISLANG